MGEVTCAGIPATGEADHAPMSLWSNYLAEMTVPHHLHVMVDFVIQ